ncbi:DUF2397 family protein [Spiractinospora alimapuensis]|uniref:DUF2397 family protein n=1 Tax=Spiractinospora alimapuensis TaxID=2820884 RepID=UPI001F1F7E21|nr:DUF2397 family protein [Spiractinospora alimapuensis]QVQ51013.1 DUF2397 family protein [Spiractinospora alimapuensis]
MGDSAKHDETSDAGGIGSAVASAAPAWRSSLLRLAARLDSASDAEAHGIAAAAYSMFPARTLMVRAREASAPVSGATSWWRAPRTAIDVGTSAVEAGVVPGNDHSHQRARLREAAESTARWRRAAAREIRAELGVPTASAGESHVPLSGAAFTVLLELLAATFGAAGFGATGERPQPGSAGETALDLRVHVADAPEASVTLRAAEGELCLEGLMIWATGYAERSHG